jgi:predicted nuclease of predicted toxin-antitoxin system
VKLLLDENLSHRIVDLLSTEYPGSDHVRNCGLRGARDGAIWEYARANGFVIVSKDDDFRERSAAEGFPPKVVWLSVGNAGTPMIAALLRRERTRLQFFERDPEAALLVVVDDSSRLT